MSPRRVRPLALRTLLACWAGALLVLAGCAQAPVRGPVSDVQRAWHEREQRLSRLVHWDLSGRIGVKNGHDAWQGTLSWQQSPKGYRIEVDGPFGQSQFQLQGGPDGVTLYTADKRQHWARDPEQLLYAETGLQMPVAGLRYWVLGLTAPHAAGARPGPAGDRRFDDQGRLTRFTQGGWQVRIPGYTHVGDYDLPKKVFISRGAIGLRLVVDRWRLHTAKGLETRRASPGRLLAAAGGP